MSTDQLNELSKELLEILKNKGSLTIQELIEWIRSKKGSNLVLSAVISELENRNLIKKIGVWEKSESLFPLPQKIELVTIKEMKPSNLKIEKKETKDEIEIKVIEYLARYYSVGELRLRLDFSSKIKELDPILRSLEEKGLIIWDRELGVITASDKLLSEYKKTKSLLDLF